MRKLKVSTINVAKQLTKKELKKIKAGESEIITPDLEIF